MCHSEHFCRLLNSFILIRIWTIVEIIVIIVSFGAEINCLDNIHVCNMEF